ncbi:MAG TPA: hypothetical protein VF243_02315, partial [Nitrosospira sp.]
MPLIRTGVLNGNLALRGLGNKLKQKRAGRLPPREGQAMQTEDSKATRKNSPPIKVYCLPEEARAIKAQAQSVGLPVAAYLRNVGLGIEVRSVLDYERIDDLAKINGDLGRLGGLLKLWLTNDERLPGIRT